MLPLLAVGAGLKLGGQFLGARRQGQAIKRAGTTLADAGHQAAADAWKIPGMVNPAIDTAYSRAGEDVFNNAWNSAANIEARGEQARGDVSSALAQGRGDITGALDQGRTDLTGYLDPYARAGEGALTSLADLANEKFKFSQDDPSYQWRLEQGQKALERTAAGRGLLASGSFAKSMANYAQGAASQEYQAAFDRFMKGQESRGKTLSTLAGLGQQSAATAGTTLAQLGLRGAETMGELGLRGAESMGRFGMDATRQAGDWTNAASVYKGNAGINSALQQANNITNAANSAIGYDLGAAGATAQSQYGLGNTWGQFYNNAGQTLGNLAGSWGQQPTQQPAYWPNQGQVGSGQYKLGPEFSIPGTPVIPDKTVYYPQSSPGGGYDPYGNWNHGYGTQKPMGWGYW